MSRENTANTFAFHHFFDTRKPRKMVWPDKPLSPPPSPWKQRFEKMFPGENWSKLSYKDRNTFVQLTLEQDWAEREQTVKYELIKRRTSRYRKLSKGQKAR